MTVEREEGREREGTEALGGGSWRQGCHERAPWGLMERKLGWRPWEQLLHPAGSTQTPVSTSLSVLLRTSSLSRVLVPRSDTSSWECVFSTVSLFCYLFFILLASTSGDLVVRRSSRRLLRPCASVAAHACELCPCRLTR